MDPVASFREWIEYKVHVVVPTFYDLPIRIFDALITGGIPMVPEYFRGHPSLRNVCDWLTFYDPSDLTDLVSLVNASIEKFDHAGAEGVAQRVSFALKHFHLDSAVRDLVSCSHDGP
jgi:hypothetical protein